MYKFYGSISKYLDPIPEAALLGVPRETTAVFPFESARGLTLLNEDRSLKGSNTLYWNPALPSEEVQSPATV